MKDGETWETHFRSQCPKKHHDWNKDVKMCARWHIKGDCYNTCPCAISHIPGHKVPPKQKADFLSFMKECRECITNNKKDWLIGLGLSGVRPPKKPPESNIPKTISLPFEFKYKTLSAQMIPTFLPQVPLSNLCLPQWASWRITPESENPSPWLPLTTTAAAKPETAKQSRNNSTSECNTCSPRSKSLSLNIE